MVSADFLHKGEQSQDKAPDKSTICVSSTSCSHRAPARIRRVAESQEPRRNDESDHIPGSMLVGSSSQPPTTGIHVDGLPARSTRARPTPRRWTLGLTPSHHTTDV